MTVNVYEVPLQSVPQSLGIALANVAYVLTVNWCWPAQCWILNIFDGGTLDPILLGVPLVTGVDLLAQFEYLGIQGALLVQTDHDTLLQPTFDNLGSSSHLYFVPR